jgi:CBS domain-containing protein
MQVCEVMTPLRESVRADSTVQVALARMQALGVGALPVCEHGEVIGLLTDRGADRGQAVSDVMSPHVACCPEDLDVQEAARLMRNRQVRWLVVLGRDRRPIGLVSLAQMAVGTRAPVGPIPGTA